MTSTKTKIEHLDHVLTVDGERRILRDATVIVEADRITDIAPARELEHVGADRIIDGKGKLMTPGFVNVHDHLDSHVFRGLFADDFGPTYIADVCAARTAMDPEQAYVSTLSSLSEFLRGGTTCVLTPGDEVHLDRAIDAHVDSGARTIVSRNVSDIPNPISVPVMSTEEALADLRATLERYADYGDGRITPWVALSHATEWVSEELAVGAKRVADEHGTGFTFHQAARQGQVDKCLAEHGVRPVEYLERIGVLGPNVVIGHCLRVDDREIALMADSGTRAAMCPNASVRIGFGTSTHGRLPEMLEAGVVVGLGTDSSEFGPADVLRAANLTATLYKDGRLDTTLVPGETALELATIGGAKTLGLDHEIGSIEVGKKADLVLFDTMRSEWRPLLDPVYNLIYTADRHSVHTVLVDGRVRVEDGRMVDVDEPALWAKLQEAAERASAAAGVAVQDRWPISG